jgi:hypothetical protein
MKTKILLTIYCLAAIITYGHAVNTPPVGSGLNAGAPLYGFFCGAAWPLYVSYLAFKPSED